MKTTMKSSFRKLKGFGLNRHEKRERRCREKCLPKLDEISQASQDMHDMRDCYDSLLSAAAATANSAYEFSESLREMGDCLLEKTALNDDEEGGRVLLMLGKVQFEIQKLVDNYRSHISRTITVPSESLLNELRIVEDMKRQCDEKRDAYEDMIKRQKEKGRSKSSKGEYISSHQLQNAQDEYDEEATVFVFRMKSLKRGQSRSLLTQAARHHAAQMSFFRKALKSIEAVEPHVKLVTEQQHIDYQFSGLEDDDRDSVFLTDDEEDDEDSDDGYETRDDGELSFDYRRNDQGKDVSISGSSMELDHADLTFPQVVAPMNALKENIDRKPLWNSATFGRDLNPGTKSAPLSADNSFDPAERFRQMRQSSGRKFHTYVLPTPKSSVSSGADVQVPQARRSSISMGTPNLWHSSPLEFNQYEKTFGREKFSGPIASNTQSILKESNNNNKTSPLPPLEGHSSPQREPRSASSIKKVKRQAFSGPLTSNSWTLKPILSASGPINPTGHPQLFSGSLLRKPLARPASSPKLSASAVFVSSPKISELHELPRPPVHLSIKKPSSLVGYSAPLVGSKGAPLTPTNKPIKTFTAASALPIPPETLSRSRSIPSRGQREMDMVPKLLETRNLKMADCIVSPPLTPVFASLS